MVMREYWANVYSNIFGATVIVGFEAETLRESQVMNGEHGGIPNGAVFRIHVRLKPEGAPERYLDDAQRWAWEDAARRGTTPRYD